MSKPNVITIDGVDYRPCDIPPGALQKATKEQSDQPTEPVEPTDQNAAPEPE